MGLCAGREGQAGVRASSIRRRQWRGSLSRKSRAAVVAIDAPLETCAVWRRLKLHPAREIYLIEMGTMVKKMGKHRKYGAAAMAA